MTFICHQAATFADTKNVSPDLPRRWFSLSSWGVSGAGLLMKNTQTVTFVKSHCKWQTPVRVQGKLETEGEGLAARNTWKELSVLSVWVLRLSCWTDAEGVRKVTVVANSCLCSRNHSCRGRKPQAWALPRQRGSWNKSKDYGLTPQRVWRNFYNG